MVSIDAVHAALERHGYAAPRNGRVVGLAATAATCSLVALAFCVTLGRLEPPTTVSAPLTMALLPLPSDERPKPKVIETPKVIPKPATVDLRRVVEPSPPPIVTPLPVSLAAAIAQRPASDPAPAKTETAATPSPPTPAEPPAQTAHATPGPDKWEGRVLARLERFRRYPADARRARQQGTAYVRFRIDRDGHVLSASLERSSGYSALDDAALETLRRADPLPKVPADRPDPVDLLVPVAFSITP